jgi:transcription antitermination factor NusG
MVKVKKSGLKYYAIKTKAGQERNLVVDVLKHFFCGDVPDIYEDINLKLDKPEGQTELKDFDVAKDNKWCIVDDIVDAKGYVVVGVKDKRNAELLIKKTRRYSKKLLDWRVGDRQVEFLKAGKVIPSKRIINEGDIVIPTSGMFHGEAMRVVSSKGDDLIIEVMGAMISTKVQIKAKDVVAE